jgi:hypothetical protein
VRIEIIRCDECTIEKREVNHWHRVRFSDCSVLLGLGSPIGEQKAPTWQWADLCGDACLHKFIDRKLKIGAHRPKPEEEPHAEN